MRIFFLLFPLVLSKMIGDEHPNELERLLHSEGPHKTENIYRSKFWTIEVLQEEDILRELEREKEQEKEGLKAEKAKFRILTEDERDAMVMKELNDVHDANVNIVNS